MDRRQPPIIKNATEFDIVLPEYKKYTLSNGIPMYAVPAFQQETLMIEWTFEAGSWYESAPLVALATSTLMKNGTADRNAFQINEEIEFYGAFLNVRCTYQTVSVTLHCLKKNVHNLLPILQEILTSSVFPEEELNLYKQNRIQKLIVKLKKSDFVANREIDALLFGKTYPYGRYSTKEDYQSLERQALQNYFKEYISSRRCKIFVAGNMTKDFPEQMEKYFGMSFGKETDPRPLHYSAEPNGKKELHLEVGGERSVQGSVRIARLFPDRNHPDAQKMQVLNTIFGGYFGSRLMRNIREEKGYTYGIYSNLSAYAHAGSLVVQTEAGKDVCEAVVEEVFKEMKILRERPVPEEELRLVRNYLMGNLVAGLDGAFKVIRYWKGLLLADFEAAHFYESVATIKGISGKELQELANTYFCPEDYHTLIAI